MFIEYISLKDPTQKGLHVEISSIKICVKGNNSNCKIFRHQNYLSFYLLPTFNVCYLKYIILKIKMAKNITKGIVDIMMFIPEMKLLYATLSGSDPLMK